MALRGTIRTYSISTGDSFRLEMGRTWVGPGWEGSGMVMYVLVRVEGLLSLD